MIEIVSKEHNYTIKNNVLSKHTTLCVGVAHHFKHVKLAQNDSVYCTVMFQQHIQLKLCQGNYDEVC